MDDAGSRTGKADRRMATWRPSVETGRRTPGDPYAAARPEGPQEVSRARWLGVGFVMLALAATVVLAATAPAAPTLDAGPPATPRPSTMASTGSLPGSGTAPREAPGIVPPEDTATNDRDLDLRITLPELEPGPRLRLHVFRNGKKVADVKARDQEALVKGIRLRPGANTITAALDGPGGLGPVSAPLVMTLDTEAPSLRVSAPRDGQIVDDPSITVRGTSDPGALVTVANAARGAPFAVTPGPDGVFRVAVPLASGLNRIRVRSEDDLGNSRTADVEITRGAFQADLELRLKPASLKLERLPSQVTVTLTVTDAVGRPVDGARVIFSIGPFGQPTEVYPTSTKDGRAVWRKTIIRDLALRGTGKVTAKVWLPDGRTRIVSRDFPFT